MHCIPLYSLQGGASARALLESSGFKEFPVPDPQLSHISYEVKNDGTDCELILIPNLTASSITQETSLGVSIRGFLDYIE